MSTISVDHPKRIVVAAAAFLLVLIAAWPALVGNVAAQLADRQGTIDVGWDQFDLVLETEGRRRSISGTDGKCTLPSGRYEVLYVTLKATDAGGGEWRMRSGHWGEPIEVRPGRTTKLVVGPSFTVRIDVPRHRVQAGAIVPLGLRVTDARGRTYGAPRPIGRGRQRPSVQVLDSGGGPIGTYPMAYG